jgi:hypothetical protein
MVGLGRFELPTSPLSGVRSNQLSYRPELRALTAQGSYSCLQVFEKQKGFEDQVNMLASYAGDDHRMTYEKQRRLDSDSLRARSGTSTKGVHGNIPLTQARRPVRYRGASDECHDVLS